MSSDSRWLVAAASVTGAGHAATGDACQDAHAWRITAGGDLIVVVCDGAGSSTRGGDAARFVTDTLCGAPSLETWLSEAHTEQDWRPFVESLFRQARAELVTFAERTDPSVAIDDFACTVQIAVATDSALYVAHVGDGRAAARFDASGDWVVLFVPERGDTANETVFLSTRISFDAAYWQSAAGCLPGRANAVAMMTDGCEMTAFECYVADGTNGFHDPNRPFPGFFNPVADKLASFARDGIPQPDVDGRWEDFIRDGLPRFAAESDDRTMVFAVRKD